MTAETTAPTLAEQLRAETAPNRNTGLIDLTLLTAAADEIDRTRPIVDAVLARQAHRATYPAADDHPDLDSYAAATEAWIVTDLNLARGITRAAEAHLGCADGGWQTGTEQADTGSLA